MTHPGRIGVIAAVVVAMGALTACSSGSTGTATTTAAMTTPTTPPATMTTTPTPPPAATRAAVRSYFSTAGGKELLLFARTTASLSSGTTPTLGTCNRFIDTVLPKIGEPNALATFAGSIPDTVLATYFRRDVSSKYFMLVGCRRRDPRINVIAGQLRDNARLLRARLALSEIAI
jgi:hypothetical protein